MTGDADAVHAGIIEAQRKQIKEFTKLFNSVQPFYWG